MSKGPYPFAAREAIYARYTKDQLDFALADAREAEGWYFDDSFTIRMELKKRSQQLEVYALGDEDQPLGNDDVEAIGPDRCWVRLSDVLHRFGPWGDLWISDL